MIDSVYKTDEKYYPKVFIQNNILRSIRNSSFQSFGSSSWNIRKTFLVIFQACGWKVHFPQKQEIFSEWFLFVILSSESSFLKFLNLIQDGLFRGCSRMEGREEGQKSPLPKICHIYLTMMKLCTIIPYPK